MYASLIVGQGVMSDDSTTARPVTPAGPTSSTSSGDDQVLAESVQPSEPARALDSGIIRETTYKLPGSREQVPATEATGADLASVQATTVLMNRSGAEQITADRVSLERSGAKTLNTKSAQLDRSGVVAMSSDNAVLMQSSAIQIVADEVRLSKSSAVFVNAEKATIENSRIVLFAGNTDGDVHAILTPRNAAILGGAFAIVLTLLSLLLRSRSED